MREDGFDQVGGSVEHVLAVVENQQPDPALQRGGHRLTHGLTRLLGDAQHRRHRIGHRRRIGDGRQFEKPNPVGKFIGQARRSTARRVLPTPPTPVNVTNRCSWSRFHLVDLGLAPDEAGDRRPQIPRTHVQCPQRRKLRAQALRSHLEHTDRHRHIA